mgnify:FL=1
MALTFQSLYTNYTDHTSDTNAGNITIGKARINDTYKELLGMHDWYFAEKTATFTPTASDYTYDLSYDFGRMVAVTVKVGDAHYSLTEAASHDEWQRIQMYRDTSTSDYPTHYHITGDELQIYPVPSSTAASATGTMYYIKRVVDMTADDYTTGTVTLTNASTTVTGSGTTFTAAMVGRSIKGTVDARWYELASFTSTTVMATKKAFQGTTDSSLAYTIGEVPIIPEDYHNLLWYQPVATYWMMKKETDQAAYYQSLYERGKKEFFNAYSKRSRIQILNPPGGRYGRPIPTAYGANRWGEPTVAWGGSEEFWGGSN